MGSDSLESLKERLVALTVKRGFPAELGLLMAGELRTEWALSRMAGYLSHTTPGSAEDMVDEMLAICADRDHFREKKEAEWYQQKYNEMLWEEKQ